MVSVIIAVLLLLKFINVPPVGGSKQRTMTLLTVNDPVNGSGKKKVRFGDPLDDRSNHPDPGHPVINNLVPKKKIKIASTHEETTQKSEVIENKRATEKLTTPIDESQGMSVNILVAKKKTKVAASLNPVPTIDENIE